MRDNHIIKQGNVVLVDPNSVNVNTNQINSIPQYEKMHIHADLIVKRRGRTVIFNGGTTTDRSITVNLMGFNQNEGSPNFGNFTTNYYDGSTGNDIQYESFGIQSIKTSINSSYIPQVEIQFVDIRGLSFFNQSVDKETSPYRILFDFPPPIFELTIKGYYGKALRYKLHLVNYTTEFNSNNGNFVINANFVAITFAPLSDILFRYIVNFPLMVSGEFDPNPGSPPKNTFELVLKTKKLITATKDFKKDSIENKRYEEVIEEISKVNQLLVFLNGSLQSSKLVGVGNIPMFFIKNKSENSETVFIDGAGGSITQINNIREYDKLITELGVKGTPYNMNDRLYVGFLIGETVEDEASPAFDTSRMLKYKLALNKLRDEIINKTRTEIGGGGYAELIRESQTLESRYNLDGRLNQGIVRFAVIDLTDYYIHIYKQLNELNAEKTELINVVNTAINNIILNELGILPTIYNIFEIILNDVDTFFNILRTTSINADRHHNEPPEAKSMIMGGNLRDIGTNEDERIFPFPLVIRNKSENGRLVEERIAPIELSNSMADMFGPFPELVLVKDFITTFRRQIDLNRQYNMMGDQNADGSHVWIPISPFDSRLGTTNTNTPYIGVDSSVGGGELNPIPLSNDSRLNQVLKILLRRFYVLTQYVLPNKFISDDGVDIELIRKHAIGEAINLATSITNQNLRNNLKEFANRYKNNIDGLVGNDGYISQNIPEYWNGVGNSNEFINLHRPIYVNKNSNNYVGCKIINQDLDLVEVTIGQSSKPIDVFRGEIKRTLMGRIFRGNADETFLGYIEENLFYIPDGVDNEGRNEEYGTILKSRFCLKYDDIIHVEGINSERQIEIHLKSITRLYGINMDRYVGNDYGNFKTNRSRASRLNLFGDVIDVWVKNLAQIIDRDNQLYNKIFNYKDTNEFDARISSIILLSNFGFTVSPFNVHSRHLNEFVFTVPAVVNVPSFLPLYVGSLVDIEVDGDFFIKLRNFFVYGAGSELTSRGYLIFADIVDIIQNTSIKEKREFKKLYDTWYKNGSTDSGYGKLITNMYAMFQEYFENDVKDRSSEREREKLFSRLLSVSVDHDYYSHTIAPLTKDNYILNFSELTFNYNELSQDEYSPLAEVVQRNNIEVSRFFKEFLNRLDREILKENVEINKRNKEFEKLTGDEDIITQTYYSFKNINDKWVVEPSENSPRGFPFNGINNDRLINLFAFVDRGMNPVGDTIINPEALIELIEDTDVSVFGVLSTLLSNNGFEFFPLQNFMSINYDESDGNDDWSQSFKVDTNGKVMDSPFFVCMYIGGASRMVTGIERFGNFKDDGIVNLLEPGSGHFSTPDTTDNQINLNPNFPWREVRAFRVRFAEQNQSMFTDFKIDSKEFKETNESIQILSRLAGDNRLNAPIPKGQNLFNMFENRSYSATITGLGNAMIQPTQYFQIENIPLYNGAYIILGVEHIIESNMMTTSFTGTKILKYPIPRVTNAAAILGFDGADSEMTNIESSSNDNVNIGVGVSGNPREAKYNSMYTQQIKKNG